MSLLKISRMGHPILRRKMKAVAPSAITTPAFQKLIDDMAATMIESDGAGLAAPQVFEDCRLFVARVFNDRDDDENAEPAEPEILALVNPEITPASRQIEEDWEGCLSIPDLRGVVPRYRDIKVKAHDRNGERIELQASGFMARVIQHETDHLDGILFLDRMKSMQSLSFIEEFAKYHAKRERE